MRVITWLLATLLLSTAAVAQTKPTIPQSGRTAQNTPFATLRDLAGVFSLYADYSALQAEVARATAAETGLFANKATATNGTLTNPTILGGATASGPLVWLNPTPTQNTTYAAGGLTNGVLIGAGGNTISYCPVFACVTSPTADHQRAAMLIWATTGTDNRAEENAFALEFVVNDGAYKTWHPNTYYSVGDNLAVFGTNSGYVAIAPGTSSSTGSGPVGKGSAIADGTNGLVWQWINDATLFAKVGAYEEIVVNGPSPGHAGAGQTWGRASNYGMQPGAIPTFNVFHEIDFSNNSLTDCIPGSSNCIALQIFVGGTNYSTAAIAIGRSATIPASYNPTIFGVYVAGNVAIEADIELDTQGGRYGLALGNFNPAGSSYLIANIAAAAASPTGVAISGSHPLQAISDASTANAMLNATGNYGLAGLRFTDATTPNALIMKAGMKLCFNDTDACLAYNSSSHKLVYTVGGATAQFSVSDTGAGVLRNTLTQNGSP